MRNKKEVKITTIIGKDAQSTGDFVSEGSVRIDGKINGNVTVTGTLIVGATGVINGDVSARDVVIGGEVMGNLTAPEKAELTETARILGDITTKVIVIDEKAVFQGRCDMNQEVPGKRTKPVKVTRAGKKSAKAAVFEALKEVEEANKVEETEENTVEEAGNT